MRSKTVLWLIALFGVSTFFSCRKGGVLSRDGESVLDSFSYYKGQLAKAKDYLIAGKYDSSTYLVRLLLDDVATLPQSKEVLRLKSEAYNVIGCNKSGSNRQESIEMFQKAYAYSLESDYTQFTYGVCVNLADAYAQNGNIVEGIFYLNRALFLSDSLNIPEKRYYIYSGLGQAYLELRDFEKSNYFFEMAGLQYDQMLPYEQYNYLNARGNHYYYKEDYQSSLSYFMKARKVAESHPEMNYERSLCNINLGDLFLKLGQLDSTEALLTKCQPFFEESHNLSALYYIETLQIQLAFQQGDLQKAFKLLNKPTDTEFVLPAMFTVRQKSLQTYYEEIGNYREALRYLKKNNRLDDSIRNERVANRVAEIDMRYKQDTTLLKKTLLIQRQQSEMDHWKWLGLISAALFLASVMAILYFRKKKDYLQIRYHNRITELRMENIKNRIFPHFIFNTLMAEIATYEEQDIHGVRLQKLLSLLRQTLQQTETLALTLREELAFVQNYVDWEKFHFDGEFEFTIEMDDKTDPDAVNLLAMMIQLPVENAIKHALRGKEGKKTLIVKIHQTEEQDTVIRIQDNGPGFGVQAMGGVSSSTGTGLRVLTQTIQLLNSRNKKEIYFHISNLKEDNQIIGCQVELRIPCHYSYQLKR